MYFLLYSIFIVLFIYNIYFEFNQKFYGITPAFRNDYALLSEVLPIFLNSLTGNSGLTFLGTILFILITGASFVLLLKLMIKHFLKIRHLKITVWIAGLFWFFTIVYSTVDSYKLKHQKILDVYWMSPYIIKSMTLEGADKYKKIENSPYEAQLSRSLQNKPDIYLIFVESYGTVITESPEMKSAYLQQIKDIESRLDTAGYHIASNYSRSPVKGGRSWLAFSSFMSGLKVENQIQYNDLIQRNFDYPNMIRFFNHQGYQTYRLSTISNVDSDSLIPYARTNRYWGFDEWWTYWDFEYRGYQYDVLGGIPDQYALGYYRDVIESKNTQPKLMFFITMASHMPWYEPPPLLEDWSTFNILKVDKPLVMEGSDADRYQQAVFYDLELITRYILSGNPNSIYIIVGDHQPPGMEYMIAGITDDAATPMHIICQDNSLIQHFQSHGFQKGMSVNLDKIEYTNHESFYGIFLGGLK